MREADDRRGLRRDAFCERLERAVRTYYQLVDANDVDGVVAMFAEDAVYNRPGYDPLIGRRQIERFFRDQRVIERGRHTVTEVVVSGSVVAVHGACSATLKSGRDLDLRFADFFVANASGAFQKRDTFFFAPLV